MAASADVRAGTNHRLRVVVGLQVGVPFALLLNRLITGEVDWYGWGWQMYSYLQ